LTLTGVPGGATPIQYSPLFGTSEIKLAMIDAINSVNEPGQPPVTSLSAENRGGNTFFVNNADLFLGIAGDMGYIPNFSLPAVKDLAGNPLEPNRPDFSTQFTILMPTVALDYGDAPDPVNQVVGRYPTRNANNGPRHVVDSELTLGAAATDANVDGLPGVSANRDDVTIAIEDEGSLFVTSLSNGGAEIVIDTAAVDPTTRDGDTITIDLGTVQATLEFDILTDNTGAFDEDNFAIRPTDATSAESIAEAVKAAINESPLQPASVTSKEISSTAWVVTVSADDEDGVKLTSDVNPLGVLNHGIYTPITVGVRGAGVVEAWIDFNADGDFDDPGEQILPQVSDPAMDARRAELLPGDQQSLISNIFAGQEGVSERTFNILMPPTAPIPTELTTTYARFRVSKDGGLGPDGLALSGEIEDYAIQLLPGLPPTIEDDQAAQRSYSVSEDFLLVAEDADGSNPNQIDGLLVGVTDPDDDDVVIYSGDVRTRTLVDGDGVEAGELDLLSDGTFTFAPKLHYNGQVTFTARVADSPLRPEEMLVNSRPLTVTIDVQPVNDPPVNIVDPVEVSRQIEEDVVQQFFILDPNDASQSLIHGKYSPGPIGVTDEEDQPMFVQTAGTETGPSTGIYRSLLGGDVVVSDDGSTVIYTPPADYNGPDIDQFTYVVADDPGAGQLSETASTLGTVFISFIPVNDPPVANQDDYEVIENGSLLIPINGPANGLDGILDNDNAGPDDEDQTLTLVDFETTTLQGGSVAQENGSLRYTPKAFFSGIDRFTYTIEDNGQLQATGVVVIDVQGTNSAPIFLGIEGDGEVDDPSISRNEAKPNDQQVTYDLNTWFADPEGDPLTFAVSTSDPNVVSTNLVGSTLVLTYPAYGFGTAQLEVTASDGGVDQNPGTPGDNLSTSATIDVEVINTEDPPEVIGSLDPLNGFEDTIITADLTTVFIDRDGDVLEYDVVRLGNLFNPTAQEMLNHPLVRSIEFIGNEMQITLQKDQFGAVEIEISANDAKDDQDPGTTVSHTFTLNVTGTPDFPETNYDANGDGNISGDELDRYPVPIGSTLRVLNVNEGLLANDRDVDGDDFEVLQPGTFSTTFGEVTLNADGTFVYTNTSGMVGQVDSFEYQIIDTTNRVSTKTTVSLPLIESEYQNPLINADVNADGFITAIDALRIINFLNRELSGEGVALGVSVSEIGAPPPDFYDANGDGVVNAVDAGFVINRLPGGSNAEPEGEQVDGAAVLGITNSFVSASTSGLPIRNLELVESSQDANPVDQLLSAGFEIASGATEDAVAAVSDAEEQSSSSPDSVDEALSLLFDDIGGEDLTELREG
jgi:hypothetical protein